MYYAIIIKSVYIYIYQELSNNISYKNNAENVFIIKIYMYRYTHVKDRRVLFRFYKKNNNLIVARFLIFSKV